VSWPAGGDEQPYRYGQAGRATRQPMAPRGARTEPDHACPPDAGNYTFKVYTESIYVVRDGHQEPVLYQGRCCPLRISGKTILRCRRWWQARDGRALMPGRWHGNGAELPGGRCIMSRVAAFYVIRALEGDAAGGRPAASGRRAVDHLAPAAGRPDGRAPSLARRLLAMVNRNLGGAHGRAGTGRHRLGDAARAE